ncbi:Tachykinin-like peptides receptor 86C [Halotydeus destructor]|nr:Tachykinin-like peptides receptor 86C [Halotydeus destructor]
MTAIAIERYIKLYYPHSKRSLNAKAAILVTWTLAILLTVVQMQNLRIAQYFTEHKLIGCMNAFSESSEVPFFHHHYNYPLAVILGGVVPLVVIVVTYTLVIGRLRERNRSVSFKSDIRSHEKEKTSRKTIRMLIIMVIVYVILITPNTLLTITDYFFADLTKGCSTSTMKPSYFRFFYYMAQVSTCANVFILYWYTKSFQEELAAILAKVKMVLCCSKSTRPTTDKGEQMALTSSRSRQSMSQTTNSIIVDSPKGSYH